MFSAILVLGSTARNGRCALPVHVGSAGCELFRFHFLSSLFCFYIFCLQLFLFFNFFILKFYVKIFFSKFSISEIFCWVFFSPNFLLVQKICTTNFLFKNLWISKYSSLNFMKSFYLGIFFLSFLSLSIFSKSFCL